MRYATSVATSAVNRPPAPLRDTISPGQPIMSLRIEPHVGAYSVPCSATPSSPIPGLGVLLTEQNCLSRSARMWESLRSRYTSLSELTRLIRLQGLEILGSSCAQRCTPHQNHHLPSSVYRRSRTLIRTHCQMFRERWYVAGWSHVAAIRTAVPTAASRCSQSGLLTSATGTMPR